MLHPEGKAYEMDVRARPRREDLAELAVDYALLNGVSDLTLRPLAKALGTSDRMLLYHFGSKEALVEEIIERANARLLESMADGLAPARSPGDAVRALFAVCLTPGSRPYVRLWLEGCVLTLRDPVRYAAVHRRATAPWLVLTADALRDAGAADEDARRYATLVLDAIDGLLEDLLVTDEHERVSAAVDDLAEMVEAACRRKPSRSPAARVSRFPR